MVRETKRHGAKREQPCEPIVWQRADPAELARFDPRTKICTMNCGPSSMDPRNSAERLLLCDECMEVVP